MGRLAGLRIVVTRAAHQAEELAAPLRALGAEPILLPVIGIEPASDPDALRCAAERCHEYDWIIFSSANAVSAFAEQPGISGKCNRARIAAVGAATREAAERVGMRVSLMPERYVAEALAAAFATEDLKDRRVLIPSAAVTRDVVATELRRRGAQVDVVEAYRNVVPEEAAERAREVFQEPYPDWVTFASSSAVNHLVELVGTAPLARTRIASIGPITSETVSSHGLRVAAEAVTASVEGLIQAICESTAGE